MQSLLPFIVVGLVAGSLYGIAAMGLVLSYKTSGVFNFAHGAIGALAAATFYSLSIEHGWHWAPALVVSVGLVGGVLGLIMERVAYVLAQVNTAMKVVATVGIMVSLTSIVQLWHGFETKPFPPFLPTTKVRLFDVNIGYDQFIVIAIGVIAVVGLTILFKFSAFGRHTKAVVDDPVLFQMSGRSATIVRRWGWLIGCSFASISGILIAPKLGLDATALTLLVVQSFGAAAVGRFSSLPKAYVGALVIGVVGAISTKYAVDHPVLNGLPTSLPFLVLFVVLIATPRRLLVELGTSLERRVIAPAREAFKIRAVKLALPLIALIVVPHMVGAKLSLWTIGVVFIILFLALGLLMRTANQVSLCHMSFAAIGAVAFHNLLEKDVPWLLALVLSGVVVVPAGAFIAIPAIRLSGVYLALATLGFGILLEQQVYNTDLMFGAGGTSLPVPRPSFADTQMRYYYLVLGVVVLVYVLIRWAEHGQLGRLLRSKADSSVALASLGASVRTPSVLAFCISAFLAGIAGALIGPVFEVVGSGSFTTIPTSIMLVALLVLGGRDKRIGSFGAALGATIGLNILPAYITSGTTIGQLNVFFGVAAVEAAIHSTGKRRSRKRHSSHPDGPSSDSPASATESATSNSGSLAVEMVAKPTEVSS